MQPLRYWSFPVGYGQAAVLINTAAATSLSLVELTALPHFLTQLECARSFCAAVIVDDTPTRRRARAKPARKPIT
jgi:hypothetical protein